MEIYLVRHGQTDENKKGIFHNDNSLLNNVGRQEAKYLRRELENISFASCYTSPLLRAFETAMILVGDSVEIIPDNRITERGIGTFVGKSVEDYNTEEYWDYAKNSGKQGVEKVEDLYKRCKEFLEEIVSKYENEKILIVSHSAVIRTLHRILTNTPKNQKVLLEIDNCCLLKYQYKK